MAKTGRPLTAAHLRFFKFLVQQEDCWIWTGTMNGGYGQFSTRGPERMYAHRWSFEYFITEIPDGLQLDHLCRNRACVNPWHLEPVTGQVNTLRSTAPSALNALKTHCKRGHPFDDANTLIIPNGRECHTCRLEIYRRYRAKKRNAA